MHNAQITAMKRNKPSGPLKFAIEENLIGREVLDYGCGRGDDVTHLLKFPDHFKVSGWDPNYLLVITNQVRALPVKTDLEINKQYDTVLCTFVLNVLTKKDRIKAINNVLKLTKKNGRAIFAVRSTKDGITGTPHEDGVITARKTFQKAYTKADLQKEIPMARIIEKGRFIIAIVE